MTGTMIDCTGASLPGLRVALGGRYPDVLAGYVTGTAGVDWTAGDWEELAGHAGLFRIDQSPALNLFASLAANCADIEPGAATIDQAVIQTERRDAFEHWSWWYVPHLEEGYSLAEARQAVKDHGYKKVRFWVADWSMNLAAATAFLAANDDVNAVQWASPKSNPATVCPGTGKTLAELNADLSVTIGGWFPKTAPPAPPRTVDGVVVKFSDGSSVTY